jgi:hypothetical protein
MALIPKKLNLSEINGGREYNNGDGVQASAFNAAIQSAAYSQALSENQPLIKTDETKPSPSVEIAETTSGTPQFVFYNLGGGNGSGDSDNSASAWDLIITEELIAEKGDINTILATASGRVYVKAIQDRSASGSYEIIVPSPVKYIEFDRNLIFTTYESYLSVSITGTGKDEDCQVLVGATNDAQVDFTAPQNPIIKGFKGGVEHCHGGGWGIENCNNIHHCSFAYLKNCNNISNCTADNGTSPWGQQNRIENCKNIEDLQLTGKFNSYYTFNDCKFVKNISQAPDSTVELTVSFTNCSYLSNIDVNTNDDYHGLYGYTNCTFVDPYTCNGFLSDEDVGKVQALTKDGSFATIPNAEGVGF